MYELREDCGTSNERYKFETLQECKDWMIENREEHYKGCTEELIRSGTTHCGIDTITLEEIYPTYELSEGSLLQEKSSCKGLYMVNSVDVNSMGFTKVNTQECWFYEGRLCYDYECYGASSVQDIYKRYNLVGEDFKLFEE